MKYYQILNLPHDCSQNEIKKRYHELVLIYHPDKNSETNIEFFHKIQEAYETLSNEDKRREYDIECKIHRFDPRDYIFTEEDYKLIFDYVRRIQSSVEYRFFMSLFCKIPRECKEDLNTKFTNINENFQTHEFLKKMKKKRVLNLSSIKTIDITGLYEDITLHLHISLEKVYKGFCNEIMIKCREKIIRIFVTRSNYIFRALNDIYRVTLEFYTDINSYKIVDNSLIYRYKMNLYEYYYEDNFVIKLPNNNTIRVHRDTDKYYNVGLLNNKLSNGDTRGILYIRFILNLEKPKNDHKDLIKMIFQK